MTTSIVRVIEIPRALLDNFLSRQEAKQVGLYFLFGDAGRLDLPSVYIGQSGSLGARLLEHHRNKDFWERALVVVSLTNSFTQTHTLSLEWSAIKRANEIDRYSVENGNDGSKPHTPAPLEADCVEIFETARTLLATLGHPIFEPLVRPNTVSATAPPDGATSSSTLDVELFYCRSTNYDATGEYTEEGFVVLQGSIARHDTGASLLNTSAGKRRQSLIDEGVLKAENGFLVFQRDVLFKTPSGAGDTVTGTSVNGWLVWKSKGGKTLDELKRKSLAG